jgi:tetratricopeptide (TPR) repeat protein
MQQDNSSFWTDIKTFEDQLAKSPNSFCFARLSEVYLKVGLVDDALHAARQGVAKHPGYLAGQRALAMACNAKGLNEECMASLKLVTVAMPEDHQAQKLLGRLLAEAGDLDAARQAYQTVIEFVPGDVECRMQLDALEFPGESSVSPVAAVDEEDDEIIEDLEMLEEIEVFDEDQPDFEEEHEGQLLVTDPVLDEPHHDPLSTGTLAELYVEQGFIHKALEIYRTILAETPANSAASKRIAELELLDSPAVESVGVNSDEDMDISVDNEGSDFETDSSLLGSVFAAVPESMILSELPPMNEALQDMPVEAVAAVKPQGSADNAVSTLEGWLDNIRRVKSCR